MRPRHSHQGRLAGPARPRPRARLRQQRRRLFRHRVMGLEKLPQKLTGSEAAMSANHASFIKS